MAGSSCSVTPNRSGDGSPGVLPSTPDGIAQPASSEHDELQRSADALVKWLHESDILAADSQACAASYSPTRCTPRVSGLSLVSPQFIAEVVRCICPSTHEGQRQRLAGTGGEAASLDPEGLIADDIDATKLNVAASCLDSVFEERWGVPVKAAELMDKAVAAGAAEFEPLADIVWLWKYVLVYAALCESRERHVGWIFSADPDFRDKMVSMIQEVEALCPIPTEEGPEGDDCSSLPAASPAEGRKPRKRRSSLSLLGVSPHRESTGGRCSIGGGAAVASTPAPAQPRQSANGDSSFVKDQHFQDISFNSSFSKDPLAVENAALRAQVQELQERVQELQDLQEQVDRDRQFLKDGELESYYISWDAEKQLKERQEQMKALQSKVHASHQRMGNYDALLEEVEILRHQRGEHNALQERHAKCEEHMETLAALAKEGDMWKRKHTELSKANEELSQEVELLTRDNANAQMWKRKAQEAEASLSIALMDVEVAQKDAAEAMKKMQAKEEEQELLRTEHSVLTDQLKDAQMLRVSDAEGACERGIVEPFTYELKEKMRSLEQRNAFLEQRFTKEEVLEREGYKVTIEGLQTHLERAESSYKASAEDCKRLNGELELQRSTAESLKSELFETRTREGFTEGKLERCNAELERCKAELEAALNDTSKVEPLEKELQEVKVQLLEEKDQREDLSQELESARETLEERDRQVQELEPFRAEALRLRRQGDLAKFQQELREERREAKEVERELERLIKEQGERFEKNKRQDGEETQRLRSQLQQLHWGKEQALKELAAARECEDKWGQKQGSLVSQIEDLRKGLAKESEIKQNLEKQVEYLETEKQIAEDLAEKHAPADLARLKQRHKEGKQLGLPLTDLEEKRQRKEMQGLQKQLRDQQLWNADIAGQLARESEKSRRLERQLNAARQAPVLQTSVQPEAKVDTEACPPAVSRTRQPLQELPPQEVPMPGLPPKSALKSNSKTVSASVMDESAKENCPMSVPDTLQSKLGHNFGGHKVSPKRPGIIGRS